MIEKYTLERRRYDVSVLSSCGKAGLLSRLRAFHYRIKISYPLYLKYRCLTLGDFLRLYEITYSKKERSPLRKKIFLEFHLFLLYVLFYRLFVSIYDDDTLFYDENDEFTHFVLHGGTYLTLLQISQYMALALVKKKRGTFLCHLKDSNLNNGYINKTIWYPFVEGVVRSVAGDIEWRCLREYSNEDFEELFLSVYNEKGHFSAFKELYWDHIDRTIQFSYHAQPYLSKLKALLKYEMAWNQDFKEIMIDVIRGNDGKIYLDFVSDENLHSLKRFLNYFKDNFDFDFWSSTFSHVQKDIDSIFRVNKEYLLNLALSDLDKFGTFTSEKARSIIESSIDHLNYLWDRNFRGFIGRLGKNEFVIWFSRLKKLTREIEKTLDEILKMQI